MAWSRKVSIAILIAPAALATAGRARAQALGPPPTFPVTISAAQPGTTIQLSGPTGPIACGERCTLQLLQAEYRLVVTDGEGLVSTQKLYVRMPTSAVVTPRDNGSRKLGLGVMVVGLASALVGSVVLLAILGQKFIETISRDCAGPCMDGDVATSTWIVMGVTLGAGAAVAMTGLGIWHKNLHATVRTDGAPAANDGDRLRLTPVAGLRWGGLALTGRF